MRTLIMILLLAGSAKAQQLVTFQDKSVPREAESILLESCRAVGERFEISMPDPKVELHLGEKMDAVEGESMIHMRRWNRKVFKSATLLVCIHAAETELVYSMLRESEKTESRQGAAQASALHEPW